MEIRKKNGLEDLQKADWFLQRLIKKSNGDTNLDFYSFKHKIFTLFLIPIWIGINLITIIMLI